MNSQSAKITYRDTGYYSRIVLDYLDGRIELQPFYTHAVNIDGIKAAIKGRDSYPTNRKLLVDVLEKHYAAETPTTQQLSNIEHLKSSNCFTVTTAHQPNIFTGHLYFIYKILHTIKLCQVLKAAMPENEFVPVFYMGSEDADLDELGHVYINGNKHEWNTSQTGAVGRMKIDKALVAVLDNISGELAVQPFGREITDLMKSCYVVGATVELATFKLVNALFGEFGLLILLPDDTDYKKAFIPVVEAELTTQFSNQMVEKTVSAFPKEYKVQAGGREINLFYLNGNIRERIEKRGAEYFVVNSEIKFTLNELIEELKKYPERFSPNVILRPVFQEMILPNIAFIGGGGELAYWLELKEVFASVNVPFPVLVLRNSFMLLENKYAEKARQLGFDVLDLFKSEQNLLTALVKRNTELRLSLGAEKQAIQAFYAQLGTTAAAVDISLQPHTGALEKLALRKIEALEKKMLRAEKRKFEAQQRQLHKLKSQLFPHENLQERVENFMPFYAKWGAGFLKTVFESSPGLEQQFVILEFS